MFVYTDVCIYRCLYIQIFVYTDIYISNLLSKDACTRFVIKHIFQSVFPPFHYFDVQRCGDQQNEQQTDKAQHAPLWGKTSNFKHFARCGGLQA